MINVFGLKITGKDDKTALDGECFITERLEESEEKTIDQLNDEFDEQIKRAELPLYLRIIKFICTVLALIAVASIIRADVPFDVAFGNAPYIFIAGVAAATIAIALWIIEAVKRNGYLNSEEYRQHCEKEDAAAKNIMTRLNIPEDAELIDVLAQSYKLNDNNIVKKSIFEAKPQFMPIELFMYKDEKGLRLADCTGVFTFPYDEIIGIDPVNNKAILLEWNKPESIKSEKYKPYKMTSDNLDRIHVKNYYSLKIKRCSTDYEILIPEYEIDSVARLLEITITNE